MITLVTYSAPGLPRQEVGRLSTPSMAESMKATTTLLTRREARTSTTLTTLRTLDSTSTSMMSHLVLAMATSLGLASAMVMATIVHDSCRFYFFFVDKQQCLKYTTINNW